MVGERLQILFEKLQEQGKIQSKKDFAELIGVDYGSLSKYFTNKVNLSINDLNYQKYKINNINLDWLLTGEGEMFRNTEIAKSENTRIPLLRQTVSCGPGKTWEHEDNIESWIVPWDAFPNPTNGKLYAFRAEGISMAGAGISSGDILIFDGSHGQDAIDDIYVFSLFGSVYCKLIRFDSISRKIHILEMPDTENPKQAVELRVISMDDPAAEDFHVLGRVLAWIHENRVIRK